MGLRRADLPPLGVIVLGILVGLVSHKVGGFIGLVGFTWLAATAPAAALGVFLLSAAFPLTFHVAGHRAFLSDVMALILLVVMVVRYRKESVENVTKRLFPTAFRWPVLLLLFVAVLSLYHAMSHTETLIKIVEYIEFFVVIVAVAADQGLDPVKWRPAIAGLISAGAAVAIAGVVQFMLGIGPKSFIVGHHHTRAYIFFGQPNAFGGFLAQIFPLALALFIFGPKDRSRPWTFVALCLLGLGIFASFSRGAEVAVLVAILVMIVMAFVTRGREVAGRLAGFGLVIPAAALLAMTELQHLSVGHVHAAAGTYKAYNPMSRLASVATVQRDYDTHQRLLIWKAALRVFKLHKLTGVGLGGFHYWVLKHPIPGIKGAPPHAHDIYLEYAADMGIGGVIAILWYQWRWVSVAYKAIREYFGKLDEFMWALTLGAGGVIVDFGVHDTVDLLVDHAVILPLLVALGVLAAVVQHAANRTPGEQA
jgi:O-antigen ligase